jgi:hypothetical protein
MAQVGSDKDGYVTVEYDFTSETHDIRITAWNVKDLDEDGYAKDETRIFVSIEELEDAIAQIKATMKRWDDEAIQRVEDLRDRHKANPEAFVPLERIE